MADALNMGGYAAYVWPCYIVTVLVLAALVLTARRSIRRQEEALAELEEDTAAQAPAEPMLKDTGE